MSWLGIGLNVDQVGACKAAGVASLVIGVRLPQSALHTRYGIAVGGRRLLSAMASRRRRCRPGFRASQEPASGEGDPLLVLRKSKRGSESRTEKRVSVVGCQISYSAMRLSALHARSNHLLRASSKARC